MIKKVLVGRCDLTTLMEVHENLPQLELDRDLAFMRWKNAFGLGDKNLARVDLKELA